MAGTPDWVPLIAAPVIGSFLGVVIRRLPAGRPFAAGRSQCEQCGTVLRPSDLVPLVSWAVLRGRCRHCGAALGWFYPAIELAAVAVAVIALIADAGSRLWLDCLLGWWLLVLASIDLRQWLLPDALTLPLLAVGLAEAALLDWPALPGRAIGAALGYGLLWAVAAAYRRWRGREGLGMGDAKLLAAGGAWLGAVALPQVIFVAAVTALVVAASLQLTGARLKATSALPFGPFLAASIWALWLFGPLPFR